MMRYLRLMRVLLALFICFAFFLLFAGFHLYGTIIWNAIRRHDAHERRRRVHACASLWVNVTVRAVCLLAPFSINFRLPAVSSPLPPAIVLANHRSMIDVLIIYVALHRLGYQDIRYVAMNEVRLIPVIGRLALDTGCCLVKRHNNPADIRRLVRFAKAAKRDGSTVVVFPEGTTFGFPSFLAPTHETYSHVLPPLVNGVKLLRRELPRHAVLSFTNDWHGNDGFWFWRMVQLAELGLTVSGEFIPETMIAGRVEDWLVTEWRRKDQILAENAVRRRN